MTIFLAGASGTIGRPLVRALVAAGYGVHATTRSRDRADALAQLGATPVVVDALDAVALERAVREAAPTHVIHQLTALPAGGPRKASDLAATNRLREDGTRHLLRASIAAGAQRLICGSFAPLAASGLSADRLLGPAARAIASMEAQVLDAARSGALEAVVLRYGLFYGDGTSTTSDMLRLVRARRLPVVRGDRGQLPFIYLDDAVSATVAAVTRGESGRVYDIVDDRLASIGETVAAAAEITGAPKPFAVPRWLLRIGAPYLARVMALRSSASNHAAKQDLGWAPAVPTYREGLSRAAGVRAAG
jgi:nucleoside-diphosphate-sugar epimerase